MKYLWASIFLAVLIWSGIKPHDYFTWFLEVFPALIGFLFIIFTRHKFPLTPLVYVLILLHSIILMVGGHYTYAEVPLFDWIKDVFHQSRNNYDKLGHFAQGFVPSMIAREILIRKKVINGKHWLTFLVVCFALALSAFYELVEWWVAISTGDSAEAFLGTQGYVWDTQSDMALALLGSLTAVLFFSRWHDSQLNEQGHQY